MVRTLHICIALLLPAWLMAQTVIFEEDFDSYSDGQLLAQTAGLPWTTWSNTPGSAEDTPISSDQAYSGTLSAKFSGSAAGGPSDIMLQLGNRTSGHYLLGWWMYIPATQGGYFNIQKSIVAGEAWSIDVIFRASGSIELSTNAQVGATTTYPQDEWFLVGLSIDLNTSTGVVTVNGDNAGTWITTTAVGAGGVGLNQIGGVNFFAYAGGDPNEYYIDDVSFVDISNVGIEEVMAGDLAIYPNPATDVLNVELNGSSMGAIASLVDLTGRVVIDGRSFMQQGTLARTQLSLQGMPSGLYLLRVLDGDRELVRRVTKE